MAGKFKVDQDEVEVDQLLRNLDKKKDAYIRSQNWDAEQQKAFSEQYNKIRAGIADGTVSGRNSDRSYVDSSQSFQNAKEGYDSVEKYFVTQTKYWMQDQVNLLLRLQEVKRNIPTITYYKSLLIIILEEILLQT